jgi:imidazoleglycerol phosphate synthase glutamine amidotransferase subunit HisH
MKQNYKVLIIDDNVIDQIKATVKKKHLNLTEIHDESGGKQGLEWLRNFKTEVQPAHYSIRHQNATNGWL